MAGKALKSSAVKIGVDSLNKGEFAIFDEILSVKKAADFLKRKLLNTRGLKPPPSQD